MGQVHDDPVLRVARDLVRDPLALALHLRVAHPHEALDRRDRVLGIGDRLPPRDLSHEPLAVLGEGDDGWGGAPSLRVGDHRGLAALHDGDHRVGRSEVYADNLAHRSDVLSGVLESKRSKRAWGAPSSGIVRRRPSALAQVACREPTGQASPVSGRSGSMRAASLPFRQEIWCGICHFGRSRGCGVRSGISAWRIWTRGRGPWAQAFLGRAVESGARGRDAGPVFQDGRDLGSPRILRRGQLCGGERGLAARRGFKVELLPSVVVRPMDTTPRCPRTTGRCGCSLPCGAVRRFGPSLRTCAPGKPVHPFLPQLRPQRALPTNLWSAPASISTTPRPHLWIRRSHG